MEMSSDNGCFQVNLERNQPILSEEFLAECTLDIGDAVATQMHG